MSLSSSVVASNLPVSVRNGNDPELTVHTGIFVLCLNYTSHKVQHCSYSLWDNKFVIVVNTI